MSEIRGKVEREAEGILSNCMKEIDPHGSVGISIPEEIMIDPVGEIVRYLVEKILSISELAIVDRKAEPPEMPTVLVFTECLPSELHNRLLKIQQDMLDKGWVKEVPKDGS